MSRLFPRRVLALATLFAAVGVARGSGEPIGKSNFQSIVLSNPHLWVVEYMSPRCGTCQEMAPVWQRFVGQNGGKVKFGQVNIDDKGACAHRSGFFSRSHKSYTNIPVDPPPLL